MLEIAMNYKHKKSIIIEHSTEDLTSVSYSLMAQPKDFGKLGWTLYDTILVTFAMSCRPTVIVSAMPC